MAQSSVDRDGQAYEKLKGRLQDMRRVNGAASAASLPANDSRVVKSLAPIFPRHEQIVLGLLGKANPNATLRDLAVSNGLSDIESLAVEEGNAGTKDKDTKSFSVQSQSGAGTSGNTKTARKEAVDFRRRLFEVEPTGVLQRMVMDDDVGPFKNDSIRRSVGKFIQNQPKSFDISRTSVHSALRRSDAFADIPPEDQAEVTSAVKSLQAVQSMTKDPEAIKPLREAGLSTAFSVSSMSEPAFVAATKGKIEPAAAREIHKRATDSTIRNDHALVSLLQTARGTGIAALDGNSTLEDRKKILSNKLRSAVYGNHGDGKNCDGQCGDDDDDGEPDEDIVPTPVVDLESLFGSLDYCACSDCNSVNSPAAYFVEILQFLRNNNLHWDSTKWPNSGKTGIHGTALDALFARRPDLGCIELTCENTNTVLPYIDLANEVMESFVVHKRKYAEDRNRPKRVTLDVFNIEDETSSELLAEPQHTNYVAYCILKDAVYPIVNAPYHQALDQTRILLESMGTSRHELITTFFTPFKNEGNSDAPAQELRNLSNEHQRTLDRIAASEFWKMSQTEYIAITRESYWSKEFWVIKKKMAISTEEYQAHIQRKKTSVYWGYDSEDDIQNSDINEKSGLMFVKKQLLQRSYVTYEDLVDIVKTRYANPNMPTGRSRIILESIHFSYKYLTPMVKRDCNDQNKRYKDLARFLACWKPWAREQGVDVEECDNLCLSESEILCWLKTWFEAVGKIVILESGDVPLLPIQGRLVKHTAVIVPRILAVSDPQMPAVGTPDGETWEDLGMLGRDGMVRAQDGNLVAYVAPDSTLRGPDGGLFVAGLTDLQSLYIVSPSVKNFDDITDIFQNHILANIQRTTSLVTWNIESGDNDPPTVHYLATTETCNIDNVTIRHLDGTQLTMDEWDRMQAFLRLWRRLGWTINEVDQALSGLARSQSTSTPDDNEKMDSIDDWSQVIDSGSCLCQVCGHATSDCCCRKQTDPEEDCCNLRGPDPPIYITPEILEQLVAIKRLVDQSGMDLTQLLTLWYDIPTEGNPSLYSKLFLVHNVSGIDGVFKPDADGNFLSTPAKISEHIPVILAALRINQADLTAIMADAKIGDGLTIETISTLYRYVVLGRILTAKPILLPQVIALCGEPFVNPQLTLAMIGLWQQIRDKGYTLQQMDYLIRGVNDPLKPLGPTMATILKATKTMLDGIMQINTDHSDVADAETTAVISTTLATKVPLIFDADTTANIIGLISGTTVYSTDAPPNLSVAVPDSLSTKLQYTTVTTLTPVRATLSVTGILTPEETLAAKALSTSSDWAAALERIAKRPGRFFNETLFGIFDDIEAAKAVLLQGDIAPPPPPPPEPASTGTDTAPNPAVEQPVDNSTLRPKTVFFLRCFLRFLRKELADKLIIDTVSGSTSISDPDLQVLLLTKLIKDADGKIAIDTLRNLVNAPSSFDSSFSGYLIPNATDSFTFIAAGFDSEPPTLMVENQPVRLSNRSEDPSNVWSSDPVSLTSGKLYSFNASGQPASNLQWKTARLPAAKIPASSLLPGHASESTTSIFEKLYKAGLVINILSLVTIEVEYISENGVDFSDIDFNGFTMETWRRLADYTTLRDSLPSFDFTLIDFFKWTKTSGNPGQLGQQIATVTGWKDLATKLIAKEAFNMKDPKAFSNEMNLIQLQKAVAIQTKIGAEPESLFQWSRPLSFFWKESRAIAESIRKTLRSKYNVDTWDQVAQPLFNNLRANQRDALIAFLLVQKSLKKWGVRDADSLFEFFLIDVQMGSCLQTSRIKQAISSVQLFVQRCLLSLESDHGLDGFHFDRERWDWMSRYRVWEANRKVFLWPENWIDPTLRDDKSEIFTALEAQLLQKDLTPAALQDSLKEYLYRVDQVASLQVIGLVLDPETNVLHIFAKTITSPFAFFYRQYKQFKNIPGNWSPWESMQVDITTYEQENDKGKTETVGSYLLPVIWNGRLIAFLPEFNKKTLPVRAESDSTTIQECANRPLNASMPANFWAIKMGYTEYRNGKWTTKKISTGEVAKLPEFPKPPPPANGNNAPPPVPTPPVLPLVSSYRFVPKVVGTSPDTNIIVGAFDSSSSEAIGWFEFDGGQVLAVEPPTGSFTVSTTTTEFQFTKSLGSLAMHSYQDNPETTEPLDYIDRSPTVLYSPNNPRKPQITTSDGDEHEFYDPYSHQLLARASTSPTVEGVYNFYRGITDQDGLAAAFGNPVKPATPGGSYHELKTPFAIYNWEIGLHAPMLLMNKLLSLQQFDRALEVAHYVFDPFAKRSTPPAPGDLWQFPPFKNVVAESELEKTFALLDPNTVVPEGSVIDEWRENPFEPHVVARARRQAYMKWFALRYIEILIAYGDWYFMQNTLETIPMAIQLYIRASHLYGPRAQRIPRRGKKKVQTYNSLLDQWDGFSNAVVQMELAFPFSQQSDKPTGRLGDKNVLANIFGFATSRYFCVPNNPKLDEVRNLIDDRLYKIRHCQDINGIVRQLPLFEPPIDPGLLVQAAAAGLSFASVVSDLNSPMGNYRFSLLLQKSLELCNELKSMAGMLLSVKEKRDAEALSNLRARQEVTVGGLVMEMKKQALEDANLSLQAIRQSRSAPAYRLMHFLKLLGEDLSKVPDEESDFTEIQNRFDSLSEGAGFKLIPSEVMDMNKATDSAEKNANIGDVEALSSFLSGLPTTDAQGQPYGMGGSIKFGPQSFAQGAAATARKMRIGTETMSAEASNANRMTSFLHQQQDRVQQANSAGYEVKNIDTQLRTQEQKVKIAEQDIINQQQLIDNATEVRDFLTGKYTNEAMYSWMEDGVSSLYYQTYTLAYQLAKKAEQSYAFERGLDPSQARFISFGYWDANRAGLLAAERLYVSLKQLEAAHQSDRGHDYEIVKHVSLRQLAPLALIQLREAGSCEVTLPEVIFDIDFPGHYQRRIKTVSMSIPCVVGPYTSISCTLRLLSSELRVSAIAGSAADYPRSAEAEDPRFRTITSVPVSSIAVSSASNDSGTFELGFRDERYVPFEGAGAVGSRWRIELPTTVRTWDYSTMSDVVIHVRYTSREGGEKLATAASGAVKDFVKRAEAVSRDDGLFAVFDLRSEFGTEFARVSGPPERGSADPKPLALKGITDRLPIFARVQQSGTRKRITAQDVWVLLSKGSWVDAVELVDANGDGTEMQPGPDTGGMALYQAPGVGIDIGDWVVNFKGTSGGRLAKGMVIVRYTIS